MAKNADATCRAIVQYIGLKVGINTEFIVDMPWEEREALFDRGEIDICWICGLPYIWKVDAGRPEIELCAVPVMRHERYGNAPVYFSDVVVRRDSRFNTFADLRGANWAYNERTSHSRYNVVRHHLATLGEKSEYFSRAVESGAHQQSLRMILAGEIDASAIDSTVLEAELRRTPSMGAEIRIVATLGPSPMPPWVMHRNLPHALRSGIKDTLLGMHENPEGRAILGQWGISHFTDAEHADYQPVHDMASNALAVVL
jgi:phosphonate transport system substrate-binding protein